MTNAKFNLSAFIFDLFGSRIVMPMTKKKDVGRALALLHQEGAEVFLMMYDPLYMNPEGVKYFIDFAISHRIAVVVPSKLLLKNGGVLSVEANYGDVGRQTAQMVNRVLKDRHAANQLELEFPDRVEVGINLKIANALGVVIPDDVVGKADYVYR